MTDTGPYSWDDQSLRFRNSTGRFVANEAVKGAVKSYSDAIAEKISAETQKYNDGKVKLATWQRNVQSLIKQSATASGIIAVGGVDRFDQKARDRVQREVVHQYSYFRGLVKEVQDGTISGDALSARASMYAGTATRSYEAVRRTVNGVHYREERRNLSAGSKHCGPCVGHASQGWVVVGTLAEIGDECECLSNCNCFFTYRIRRKDEAAPPGGNIPDLEEFGPSKAAVSHPGYSKAVANQSVKSLFGPKATLQDFASAVGAPDDATVEVIPDFERAAVTITGKGYTATRTIQRGIVSGKLVIDNESFYVDKSSQGKGIGGQVFGRQVEQAARLGVSELRTEAAGSKTSDLVGYKVWPRFGYDGELPYSVKAKIDAGLIAPPYPVDKVSDLMKTKEGRSWWDENGGSVDLDFDLSEGSFSRQVWDGYRADRAKKK